MLKTDLSPFQKNIYPVKVPVSLLLLGSLLHADVLYDTDFDDFPAGNNQWAGTDGWTSNDTTSGAQSIDSGLIPALLQTASIGFNPPDSSFTFVALNLGYDHVATGVPEVEIDALLGIEDSTNSRRDDFYLSLYNSDADRLASIRFDNQDPSINNSLFGIWREDGTTQFDTELDFIPGELFNLFITLNLETNTWTADIDGMPLFENAPFTNTANTVNLGFLAFEWQISNVTTSQNGDDTLFPGDNFLLIADLSVRSATEEPNPPFVVTHSFSESNEVTLSWPTGVGFEYQVEYSTDLDTWLDTLPNSHYDNITSSSTVSYTDTSASKGLFRYYRVRQTTAP
ncbi:hypothetical protein OAG28_01610 [Akkermansiaceae bacterium]|nr:hypothetical protein [bacterium]MDB4286676.1 hypothetical protein [bacterium]MDB4412770.1 hypothetical protein [bacterium]MDB4781800.1 hypothetical protein [Akkermansiaceae bacterium]